MKKQKIFLYTLVAIFGILFSLTFVSAQQPPICLNPRGHLIWSGQTANYIPYLTGADIVSNSPLTVSGSNISAAGKITAATDVCLVSGKCLSTASGASGITGSGTANTLPIWTSANSLGDSEYKLGTNGLLRTPEGMEILRRNTTGGYAQGILFRDKAGTAIEAGIGFLGSGNNPPNTIYVGYGDSPWASANGLFVRNTGNLGIGTANPQTAVHIYQSSPMLTLQSSQTGKRGLWMKVDDINQTTFIDSSFETGSAYPMVFKIGNNEAARLSWVNSKGNFTAGGDVKGTRLCIGNDCKDSWAAASEKSGWQIDDIITNTIKTKPEISNPKVQIKDGDTIILEISQE